MKRIFQFFNQRGGNFALSSAVLLLFVVTLRANDEQWDDQFGDLEVVYYGQLVLYQNSVYGTDYKWDGTNLLEWTPPRLPAWAAAWAVKAVGASDLFLGGNASATYGLPSRGVDRWDGTNWNAVGTGIAVTDFGSFVAALATSGSELYAGGHFQYDAGIPGNTVRKWDGTNWYGLGGNLTQPQDSEVAGIVYALAVKDGIVYAGGAFDVSDSGTAGVARWDGTNWSALGNGIGGARALAFKGSELYAASMGLQKWDGTNWTLLGRADGPVYTLAFHGDDIYIGGKFASVEGVLAANIAKWDGTRWRALGSGVSGGLSEVYSIVSWGDNIILSGAFTNAGAKPSINFAIWHEMPSLNASYASGMLQLSWPSTFTNCVLEACETLSGGAWVEVSLAPTTNQYSVNPSGLSKFFRLKRRP